MTYTQFYPACWWLSKQICLQLPIVNPFSPNHMGVSENRATPKSSIKKYGFPLFSPSILGARPYFRNTHIETTGFSKKRLETVDFFRTRTVSTGWFQNPVAPLRASGFHLQKMTQTTNQIFPVAWYSITCALRISWKNTPCWQNDGLGDNNFLSVPFAEQKKGATVSAQI